VKLHNVDALIIIGYLILVALMGLPCRPDGLMGKKAGHETS